MQIQFRTMIFIAAMKHFNALPIIQYNAQYIHDA